MIPAIVKYIPFRKISDLGLNIQKEETTKNKSDTAKNRFNQ
jgi:hypothetical protein